LNIPITSGAEQNDYEALRWLEQIARRKAYVAKSDIRDQVPIKMTSYRHGYHSVTHLSGLNTVGGSQRVSLNQGQPISGTYCSGCGKFIIEHVLRELRAYSNRRISILRPSNLTSAYERGLIWEDPRGIQNNLMPPVTQVAFGQREFLNVWSNDYKTRDDVGVRDYIQVLVLPKGLLKVSEKINSPQSTAVKRSTGIGNTVRDMVEVFETASTQTATYWTSMRPIEVAVCNVYPSLAATFLGCKSEHNLAAVCQEHSGWQKQNPKGFAHA
jgi:UDP-glucose 4-epimerase